MCSSLVLDVLAMPLLRTGIQTTYEHRAKFQLPDSAAYFFDKLDEIAQEDFIPSEQGGCMH